MADQRVPAGCYQKTPVDRQNFVIAVKALLVSKRAAVESVTTWVLRLSRDGHIVGPRVWASASM